MCMCAHAVQDSRLSLGPKKLLVIASHNIYSYPMRMRKGVTSLLLSTQKSLHLEMYVLRGSKIFPKQFKIDNK